MIERFVYSDRPTGPEMNLNTDFFYRYPDLFEHVFSLCL